MLLRWTALALDDLNEISTYIEREGSVSVADDVCSKIFESVQMLANHPRLGKPGRLAGTRELIVSKYIVGYRVGADSVEIVRVRHGARQYPTF